VAEVRGALWASELDAPARFAERRERYRRSVDELFDALRGGSRFDAAWDRQVVQDLIDLAPPGLDELFALLALVEALVPDGGAAAPDGAGPAAARRQPEAAPRGTGLAAARKEPQARWGAVVLDTAPTGHALRLLGLPEAALSWVHALLEILLKYRRVFGLGELAVDLVQSARELRALKALLSDGARTCFVPVLRAAALPRLETERLLDRLGELGVAAPVLIANALTDGEHGCARCRRAARAERAELGRLAASPGGRGRAIIEAPAHQPPPRAPAGLRAWSRTWK
jgi:arsenite-transporting ATPase